MKFFLFSLIFDHPLSFTLEINNIQLRKIQIYSLMISSSTFSACSVLPHFLRSIGMCSSAATARATGHSRGTRCLPRRRRDGRTVGQNSSRGIAKTKKIRNLKIETFYWAKKCFLNSKNYFIEIHEKIGIFLNSYNIIKLNTNKYA